MTKRDVDLLIILGGDSTLSRVATVIHTLDPPPIVGVGIGSFNVGALTSLKEDELNVLNLA